MALYFFHVRGGAITAHDEEGIELEDHAAARREAIAGARDIIAAEVLEGRLRLGERIDVEDAEGQLIFTLPFTEAVDRTD